MIDIAYISYRAYRTYRELALLRGLNERQLLYGLQSLGRDHVSLRLRLRGFYFLMYGRCGVRRKLVSGGSTKQDRTIKTWHN
jgi:hypothetical protein